MTTVTKDYKEKAIPALTDKFGYKNVNELPKISKIVVNIGTGPAKEDPKLREAMGETLRLITGQKPADRKARKAIASFKIRENQSIGLSVTLRGRFMENFYEKLVKITLPRVRDFRGLDPEAFDGRGNYSFGLKEQGVFPEIPLEQIDKIHGLQVTIATTAKTDDEAYELLKIMGMPFRARGKKDDSVEVTDEDDRAKLLAHAKEKAGKTKVADA